MLGAFGTMDTRAPLGSAAFRDAEQTASLWSARRKPERTARACNGGGPWMGELGVLVDDVVLMAVFVADWGWENGATPVGHQPQVTRGDSSVPNESEGIELLLVLVC